MKTEIYIEHCDVCDRETYIKLEPSEHTKETCLRCGAIKHWSSDKFEWQRDKYDMHSNYLQAYTDIELQEELIKREKKRKAEDEERKKRLSVKVICPLCKGNENWNYPDGCNVCFGKYEVMATRVE